MGCRIYGLRTNLAGGLDLSSSDLELCLNLSLLLAMMNQGDKIYDIVILSRFLVFDYVKTIEIHEVSVTIRVWSKLFT